MLDWHSFRQADTASVTREFVAHDFPIWLPHYHDLSDGQSGLDNPEGYRMVEFPIVNYTEAFILRHCPWLDEVVFQRLASAIVSVCGVGLLYLLILQVAQLPQSRQSQPVVLTPSHFCLALTAAALTGFLPYAIYYGRTILPEPHQITWALSSLYFFVRFLRRPQAGEGIAATVCLALACLIKPTSVFFGVVFLALALYRYGAKTLIKPSFYAIALSGLAPMLAWRQWITQFPAGIPSSQIGRAHV